MAERPAAPIEALGQESQSTGGDRSTILPIFLSFSKPVFSAQQEFIRNLSEGLESFDMKPRTLGVTDYDTGVPLNAIKDLMKNSLGLISVAFRRTHIKSGEKFDDSDGRAGRKEAIRDKWLTSPWPHVSLFSLLYSGILLRYLHLEVATNMIID